MRDTMTLKGILLALLLATPGAVTAQQITRVEPPSWWIGFANQSLQLLVYGPDVATLTPSVDYPGVTLSRVERTGNPNYLFVYLSIGATTTPGTVPIRFAAGPRALVHYYDLAEKNPDPAHARGYERSDVMYLVTPDRFANGDPRNDTIEGFGDPPDRKARTGRHGGDLAGIRAHLDYIGGMGFTAIWLNPVLENRMPAASYHGYAVTDMYRVDPRYGSNADYRALADEARQAGIGIVMDLIVNHIGTGHWWMNDLPAKDWINHPGEFVQTSHARTTNQDPYATQSDIAGFADGWFVPTMPDLNQRNPLLGDYLVQNALWWIEYLGLAGIRLDTYPYPDKHYMTEWTRRVMLEYPQFNMVGEEWSVNPALVAYWQRGKKNPDGYVSYLPGLMDFPLAHTMRDGLIDAEEVYPGGLVRMYEMLGNDFLYASPGDLVVFADNHDMDRIYTQLDEQAGLTRMALAYVLTMRGTPQIYYGTEILMSNRSAPGDHGVIRSDFPGGWPGDKQNAFTGKGLRADQVAMQTWLKTLLDWRKDRPVVHNGQLAHYYPRDGVYAWFRYDKDATVMVVINKNAGPVRLDTGRFAERLKGFRGAVDAASGTRTSLDKPLAIPARDVRIFDLTQ